MTISSKGFAAAALAFFVVIALVYGITRNRDASIVVDGNAGEQAAKAAPQAPPPEDLNARDLAGTTTPPPPPPVAIDEPTTAVEVAAAETETTTVVAAAEEPEPVHYHNGLDPNQQPRDFVHMTFTAGALPAGFEASGTYELTPAGITLPPATPGDKKPRMAMVESPTLPLNFPSNAVNPLWKENSPDGTEVLVEVALSPDGEKWTDWMPTTSGHYEGEMSPTYPDGRPNPNYGYTAGDMTFYGLKQFQYFRYAMTLYSENEASPVVSDFRLFYQDSTMGDGQIAQPGAPEPTGVVQ
jgi:hypothetical protein